MANLFPRTLYPQLGLTMTSVRNVILTPMTSGISLAVSRWDTDTDRFLFRGQLKNTNTALAPLLNFWAQQDGPYEAFDFFDPVEWVWGYQIFVALTTGTLTYDLIGDNIASETIYLNGLAQSSPADYSLSAGTGTNGRDQAIFTSITPGQTITIKFTGYRCFTARFRDNQMPFARTLPFGGTGGPFEIEAW